MGNLKLPKQITLSLYDIQDDMLNVYDDYELEEQLGDYLSVTLYGMYNFQTNQEKLKLPTLIGILLTRGGYIYVS